MIKLNIIGKMVAVAIQVFTSRVYMKRYNLFVLIIFAFLMGHGQDIDKELIYGKWSLYSMRIEDIKGNSSMSVNKDSLYQTVSAMIRASRASNPKAIVSAEDSMAQLDEVKEIYALLFQTYLQFDADGHTTMLIGYEKDAEGKASKESGTYKWTGKNTIAETLGDPDNMTFVINTLTTDLLILKAYNELDKAKVIELKFRK